MIVCVLLPRFQLAIAAGEREELLKSPTALAPEPGGVQQVGEVSLAAEAFGIHAGMRLGEALARCARLTLVPPDPAGVADSWERLLVRLESVGAAVAGLDVNGDVQQDGVVYHTPAKLDRRAVAEFLGSGRRLEQADISRFGHQFSSLGEKRGRARTMRRIESYPWAERGANTMPTLTPGAKHPTQTSPLRTAQTAACVRSVTPIFRKMCWTCSLTVS